MKRRQLNHPPTTRLRVATETSVWAAMLVAAVGFGCDDGLVVKVAFQPVTGPEGVDFGVVRPGEEVRRAVTFQNPYSLVLEASLSLEGPVQRSFSAPSGLQLVRGATEVEVVYLAGGGGRGRRGGASGGYLPWRSGTTNSPS